MEHADTKHPERAPARGPVRPAHGRSHPAAHYTLSDDDIEHIRVRRGGHNRLGCALQLCAFRYPGRLLVAGEAIPLNVLRFIDAQLGVVQKARRKGMSLRAIERELGIHRSTIRRYLEAGGPPARQA